MNNKQKELDAERSAKTEALKKFEQAEEALAQWMGGEKSLTHR